MSWKTIRTSSTKAGLETGLEFGCFRSWQDQEGQHLQRVRGLQPRPGEVDFWAPRTDVAPCRHRIMQNIGKPNRTSCRIGRDEWRQVTVVSSSFFSVQYPAGREIQWGWQHSVSVTVWARSIRSTSSCTPASLGRGGGRGSEGLLSRLGSGSGWIGVPLGEAGARSSRSLRPCCQTV